jgi:hypothetical protein
VHFLMRNQTPPRSCSSAAGDFHFRGHSHNTRVRCRMVMRILGRCLAHRSKTRLALFKLLPANSSSVTRSPPRDHFSTL